MVMECCYCGKRAENGGRTFHQLPLKQPTLLQSWLNNMHLGTKFKPLRTMRLCSDHFSKKCLRKTGVNVKLVEGSVPTLFQTYKSACAYCYAVKTHDHPRSLHKFPLKNPILLQKWLAGIGRENCTPSERSRLCSDHFEKKCFRSSGHGNTLRLRNTAVPTIFMPVQSEGKHVVRENRLPNSSQKLSAAKHSLLGTKSQAAVRLMEDVAFPIFPNNVINSQPETSNVSQCFDVTDPDVNCKTGSPPIPAEESHSADLSNAIPTLVASTAQTQSGQQTTANIARRIYVTAHDHHYENSPKTMRKELMASRKKIKYLQAAVKVHKQHINRLRKRICTMKDIFARFRIPPHLAALDDEDDYRVAKDT